MSGQTTQRVRRIASPSTKQRPIKAMKPFSLINDSSPTSNLPAEQHRIKSHRRSPDSRSSPERRSPNSPSFKVERPKSVRLSPCSSGLRRTSSLDTLRNVPFDALGPYLTGQWPKDKASVTSYHHYQTPGLLSCDKSTQTPEEWEIPTPNGDKKKEGHKRSASLGNGDQLKEFRQRLQRGSKQSESNKQRQSPVPGNHQALSTPPPATYMQSKAIGIPNHIPKCNVPRSYPRNSVEGLNPEIENLTISVAEDSDEKACDSIFQLDGRRAPGPEVCRGSSTRSIDTQTPSGYVDEGATSSSGSRSHSVSPAHLLIPGPIENVRPSSIGDSTDATTKEQGRKSEEKGLENEISPDSPDINSKAASPRPNKSCSFVREPPDGCEKVKAIDEKERHAVKEPPHYGPMKVTVLRPSADSAFSPAPYRFTLQGHSNHLALKSPGVPSNSQHKTIESQ